MASIIHSPKFFKIFIPKQYKAICLFPFILIKELENTNNQLLIQHERIHYRQQLELLIIPFYIIYILEFFFKYIKYKDRHLAYKSISFEREAYLNEYDKNYLKNRVFFAMWRQPKKAQ